MSERRSYFSPTFLVTPEGNCIQVEHTLSRLFPVKQDSKYIIYAIHSERTTDGVNFIKISYAGCRDEAYQIPLDEYEIVIKDPVVKLAPQDENLLVGLWSIKDEFRIQNANEPIRDDTPTETVFFKYLQSIKMT